VGSEMCIRDSSSYALANPNADPDPDEYPSPYADPHSAAPSRD